MVAQIFFTFDSASSKNISSRIRAYDRSGSQGKRRSLHAERFISEICRCGLSLSVFQPYRYAMQQFPYPETAFASPFPPWIRKER